MEKNRPNNILPKRFHGSEINLKLSAKYLSELLGIIQGQLTNKNYEETYQIVVQKTRLIKRKIQFTVDFLNILKKLHPELNTINIKKSLDELRVRLKKSKEFKRMEKNNSPKKPKSPKKKKIASKGKRFKIKAGGGKISSAYGIPGNYFKVIYNLPRS